MKQKPTDGQTRLTADWGSPIIRATHHAGKVPERKVVTNGRMELLLNDSQVRYLTKYLRQGCEVTLTTRDARPVCRFFPLSSVDMSRIYVAALCLQPFSVDTLADKRPVACRFGSGGRHELQSTLATQEARDRFVAESRSAKLEEVTPDMVVECPRCGFEFRVGKKRGA